MYTEEILEKVKELKQTREKVRSNCFLPFYAYPQKEWNVFSSDKSLFIVVDEKDVKRGYFYTIDFVDLKELIYKLNEKVVVEIISKNKNEFSVEMETIGCNQIAVMCKVCTNNISEILIDCKEETNQYLADINDSQSIYELLWTTFDTVSSHLPDLEGIQNGIKNKEFYIIKNDKNEIVSLLQGIILPKSFYFNQIINKGDKKQYHLMVRSILKQYVNQGGMYAYAWVKEGNEASFRFFEKYGMKEDGTYSVLYEYGRHL